MSDLSTRDDFAAYHDGTWLFPEEEACIEAAERTAKGLKAMLRRLDHREAGELTLTHLGDVIPKARPRVRSNGQAYIPPRYRQYRDDLALMMASAKHGVGLTAPIHLEVVVYRRTYARADNDGFLGTVMDAGTIAGWWADDSWTVIPSTCCYTFHDPKLPRVEIKAYTVEGT